MTETNEPSGQPGQQNPGAPQYPGTQQYPDAPQHPTAPQYSSAPQYPSANAAQHPNTAQYPNPQYGAAPTPGYPNAQYGNAPYGGASYGSAPYGSAPYGSPQYGNAQYGSYGQHGYPYGYYAQRAGTNGMAIASLILGICGFLCVTPFVGLGLGIAALSRIKKTGQPGKGMAIAGIILSSAWIALMILLLATGSFHFDVGNGSGTGPTVGPTQGPDGTSA